MKKLFILSCLFFLVLDVRGQNIVVEGFVEGAKDSTIIWFNKSVNTNYKNYMADSDSTSIKNGFFKKSFNLVGTGFVTISMNSCMPRIKLIVEEGDKIKMNVKKEKEDYSIEFEGDNALGLEELNRSKTFTFKKLYPLFEECLKNAKSSDEFIEKIDNIRKKRLNPFNLLLKSKKITSSFYRILQLDSELSYLFVVNNIIYGCKEGGNSLKKLKLSENEMNEILIKLDNRYNAFDKKYENCDGLSHIVGLQCKCVNIDNNLLLEDKKDIGIWDKFNIAFSFAPVEYQELMMANSIKLSGFEQSGCSFEKFKEKFPKSVYLKALEKLNNASKLTPNLPPYTLAIYPINSKNIVIKEAKEYLGLQELIKEKLNGKSVFVDLWATYCAPCKKEFYYSGELYDFLNKNNIEMLYVSVDNEEQISKWEKDIYVYNLNGNHYFASNKIQTSLKKLLKEEGDIYVPRYLLFNAKGELVLKNTKKPSESQALYDEILKALN